MQVTAFCWLCHDFVGKHGSCEFQKAPDAVKLMELKQDSWPIIAEAFERLLELAELFCREMDVDFIFYGPLEP